MYHKISLYLSKEIPEGTLYALKRKGFDVCWHDSIMGTLIPIAPKSLGFLETKSSEFIKMQIDTKRYDYVYCIYDEEGDPMVEEYEDIKEYILAMNHWQESDEWRNRRHED